MFKNHSKKSLLLIFIFLFMTFFNISKAQDFDSSGKLNISPIVQIIGYKNLYGKYIQMIGWGSASIINNNGIIITNNHVVDDGKGNILDAFSVCITKKFKEKPVCQYTASLIARDDVKDVAILRIDPKDINGQAVNYNDFLTIPVDYDYSPKVQDDVVAIGYPWIGADTITETKGIISGISKYNDNNYIKTDTLIAGGNSGGGLVKDGKLIGIPTFGIGGFFDPSLGYALSISEAKDFISENMNKDVIERKTDLDFGSYKKNIDKLNSDQKVNDDIFNIGFSQDYEIWNYIKDKKVEIKPKLQKEILAQGITISSEDIPNISKESDFLYYLESIGIYSKLYQKLKKVTIGGIQFYNPIGISDQAQGNADYNKTYIAKINNNQMVRISIDAGLYDEKNNKKILKEIDNILSQIKFNTNGTTYKKEFAINVPKINITTEQNDITDDINGIYRKYLGNLHEFATINIAKKDLYSGKGQDTKSIFESDTSEIAQDYKKIITYKGYEGYIYCSDTNYSYYNSAYNDENGQPLNQSYCTIKIISGIIGTDNEEYTITIGINSDKNKIIKNLDTIIDFMKNKFEIKPTGDGNTNLENIYKNQVTLKYKDLSDQSKGFKNKLKYLVKYNLLRNSESFDPQKPLTWAEFLDMYFKIIYKYDISKGKVKCGSDYECLFKSYIIDVGGKKVSLYDISDDLGIKLNEYVDSDKVTSYLNDIMDIKLSGVSDVDLSEKGIIKYQNLKSDPEYQDIINKINDFNNKIYGPKKITYSDLYNETFTDYVPYTYTQYVVGVGILTGDNYKTEKFSFQFKVNQSQDDMNKYYSSCYIKKNYSSFAKCIQNMDYLTYEDASVYGYNVLTKGQAINMLFNNMDLGLFDEQLAKKKTTIISDTTNQ